MCRPSTLIRDARRDVGLTQAALAHRLGTTQSAVARLESAEHNPTVGQLDRVLRAMGRQLELTCTPVPSSVDESQVVERLKLSPGERIQLFEQSYAHLRHFALAARQSRGNVA